MSVFHFGFLGHRHTYMRPWRLVGNFCWGITFGEFWGVLMEEYGLAHPKTDMKNLNRKPLDPKPLNLKT